MQLYIIYKIVLIAWHFLYCNIGWYFERCCYLCENITFYSLICSGSDDYWVQFFNLSFLRDVPQLGTFQGHSIHDRIFMGSKFPELRCENRTQEGWVGSTNTTSELSVPRVKKVFYVQQLNGYRNLKILISKTLVAFMRICKGWGNSYCPYFTIQNKTRRLSPCKLMRYLSSMSPFL